MPGGQGCPPRAGTGASPGGLQVSVARGRVAAVPGAVAVSFSQGTGGRVMAPVRALRMAMFRSWARAARAVCRQIPSKLRAWDWSQPSTSLPVLNVSSTGQRRPAMVMKQVMVAGLSSGAQHR